MAATAARVATGNRAFGDCASASYTRADNPAYEVAVQLLAALEGTGCACVLFGSGMAGLTITVPVGQRVHPLPEGDRYLGFIFAGADTPEETAAALRAARSQLHLSIQ